GDATPATMSTPFTKPAKNYITPDGLQRLKDEHRFLLTRERPAVTQVVAWAAGNGDRSENADYIYGKRRLREIDRRIRFLTKRLDAAEIIDPTTQKSDRVLFGATVTVSDEEGSKKIFSIVGIDETDGKKGFVSWISGRSVPRPVVTLLWLGNWPHFSPTLHRLYSAPSSAKDYPFTTLISPIIIFALTTTALIYPNIVAPLWVKLYTFWAPYHF